MHTKLLRIFERPLKKIQDAYSIKITSIPSQMFSFRVDTANIETQVYATRAINEWRKCYQNN